MVLLLLAFRERVNTLENKVKHRKENPPQVDVGTLFFTVLASLLPEHFQHLPAHLLISLGSLLDVTLLRPCSLPLFSFSSWMLIPILPIMHLFWIWLIVWLSPLEGKVSVLLALLSAVPNIVSQTINTFPRKASGALQTESRPYHLNCRSTWIWNPTF